MGDIKEKEEKHTWPSREFWSLGLSLFSHSLSPLHSFYLPCLSVSHFSQTLSSLPPLLKFPNLLLITRLLTRLFPFLTKAEMRVPHGD